MRWFMLGGLLASCLCPRAAQAQPKLPPPHGGAIVNGGGLSLHFNSKRLNISASFGRTSYYQYGLIGPPVCGNWYGFASPWVAPPPPMFGPPPFFFGANPFFLPPQPPLIVTPQIFIQQPIIVQQPIVQARAEEPAEPVRVTNPERFIIIQPGMANNAAKNIFEKPKEIDLGVQAAALPLAANRANNAQAESDRQIDLGRAAFGRGEFGRALEQFRRATAIAPAESTGYFLLSQAQFAIGKYDEAVASIAEGIALRRDWPMSRFDPRGLYKQNGEAFAFHLRNLRTALESAPDDPRLLFLLGVELWFDGKRDEAKPILERAVRLARDPGPILPFLNK